MSDVDGLRAQIAEALWRDDSGSDKPLSSTGPGTQRTYARAASTLLPVVTAWAEQQARQRAAEVIDDLRGRLDWSESAVEVLDGYAAALADDGQP